ncbi:MAG: universal stress protein [Bacteroidales bacterium]|nr:universal stress protein [Bacteroidales bacterium]
MEDQIITLASYPYSRAQLLQARLEAEGIECFLSNINLVQPGIATGVKVKVRESDADKAYKIIEEFKAAFGTEKQKALDKMKSIRRILVPVDFSEQSLNACDYALGIAQKLKAEIKLLYSFFNPIVTSEPYLENQAMAFQLDPIIGNMEREAKKQITRLKQNLLDKASSENREKIKITYSLEKGVPEIVILEYAEKYRPGVIVMGTKGKGSLNFIGSVTKKVIEKSKVPVLAIPSNAVYMGMDYINKVLFATDFDDSDFATISKLMSLVRPFEMKIYCVHIATGSKQHLSDIKMDSLKNHFHEEYPDYDITCDLIEHEDVLEGLEDYIGKNDIDLIGMTTRKRNILERVFNPSIARKMLFHTHIPLLVFHSGSVG